MSLFKFKVLACYLTVLLFSSLSSAQIEITSIDSTRVGDYLISDNKLSAKIWGGLAGGFTGECASPSTTSTCNNCDTADAACNDKRIHPNLIISVNFKVVGDISGSLQVGAIDGTTIGTVYTFSSSATTFQKGDSGTVRFTWDQVCASFGVGGCTNTTLSDNTQSVAIAVTDETPSSANWATLNFVLHYPLADSTIDSLSCSDPSPSTGICFFHAIPGDQKIYVDDLESVNGYPVNNGVQFTHLRIFISETSYADANYPNGYNGSGSFVDLDIPDDDGVPDPGIVSGLENNKVYFFRPALIDQARNIAFLAGPDVSAFDSDCAAGNMLAAATTDDFVCDLIAEPLAVYGLLTEDLNCFISTAAFGSSMASEVQTFRNFRNRFMIDNQFGIWLRNNYYKYGPQAAQYIHSHPWMKPIARAALYPPLLFSKLSLKFGVQKAVVFSLISLLFICFSFVFLLGGLHKWRQNS